MGSEVEQSYFLCGSQKAERQEGSRARCSSPSQPPTYSASSSFQALPKQQPLLRIISLTYVEGILYLNHKICTHVFCLLLLMPSWPECCQQEGCCYMWSLCFVLSELWIQIKVFWFKFTSSVLLWCLQQTVNEARDEQIISFFICIFKIISSTCSV